jgi:hypothetical protein
MATEQSRKSSAKSSMPQGRPSSSGKATDQLGEGLQEALGGLTQALGGVVGGLGKTVSGVTKGVAGTVQGLLGELVGPLKQLKQQAQGGSEEAGRTYDKAVGMLQKSAKEGRTDAQELLDQLGEALDQEPPSEDKSAA